MSPLRSCAALQMARIVDILIEVCNLERSRLLLESDLPFYSIEDMRAGEAVLCSSVSGSIGTLALAKMQCLR